MCNRGLSPHIVLFVNYNMPHTDLTYRLSEIEEMLMLHKPSGSEWNESLCRAAHILQLLTEPLSHPRIATEETDIPKQPTATAISPTRARFDLRQRVSVMDYYHYLRVFFADDLSALQAFELHISEAERMDMAEEMLHSVMQASDTDEETAQAFRLVVSRYYRE